MSNKNSKNENNETLNELEELNQNNKRISPLEFKEPELHDFNAADVFEIDEADLQNKKPKRIFGKRSAKRANVKIREDFNKENESNANLKSEEVEVEEATSEKENESSVNLKPEEVEEAISEVKSVQETEKKEQLVENKMETASLDVPEKKNEGKNVEVALENLDSNLVVEAKKREEIVDSGEKTEEAEETEEIKESEDSKESESEETICVEEAMEEVFNELDETNTDESKKSKRKITGSEEFSGPKGVYEGQENLDLYEDKKHFLLSQYPIVEEYLREQSGEGFHFVRRVGKKYYFVEGAPMNYYYSINYFKDEPSEEDWKEWKENGWEFISREAGKKKKEAGWFFFRNYQKSGEYKKEIENDEEKFRFFKKYSNSCRSTVFLIFICMFCCLVTAFLQWQFKGYLLGIAICGIVFLIAFVFFWMYCRMLRHSKKRVRLLKARLRVKESNRLKMEQEKFNVTESEKDLESDWNTLDGTEKVKTKKEKKRRSKK